VAQDDPVIPEWSRNIAVPSIVSQAAVADDGAMRHCYHTAVFHQRPLPVSDTFPAMVLLIISAVLLPETKTPSALLMTVLLMRRKVDASLMFITPLPSSILVLLMMVLLMTVTSNPPPPSSSPAEMAGPLASARVRLLSVIGLVVPMKNVGSFHRALPGRR
jgi:hypothetical protein